MVTAGRVMLVGVAIVAVTACNGGDDATSPTSAAAAPGTTETSTDSTAGSSTTSSTSTTITTTTTTTPPPTTSAEDGLKAQIAADYMEAESGLYDLVHEPSLDRLADRVALVAVAGSPFYDQMVERVSSLVTVGDVVTANDPDINSVEIESIELLDDRSAVLTICRVTNRKQVTPAENSPNGQEILTLGTGELIASRSLESVALTDRGWMRDAPSEGLAAWPLEDGCEPQ